MATLEQLLNIEDIVAEACLSVLRAGNRYHQFSDATKETPGYEVRFDGTAANGQTKRLEDGCHVEREWSGILNVKIVTSRGKNSDQHAALLVHARIALWDLLHRPGDALPFHQITFMHSDPLTRGHIEEMGHDWSELHQQIVISVKDGAWPDAL